MLQTEKEGHETSLECFRSLDSFSRLIIPGEASHELSWVVYPDLLTSHEAESRVGVYLNMKHLYPPPRPLHIFWLKIPYKKEKWFSLCFNSKKIVSSVFTQLK